MERGGRKQEVVVIDSHRATRELLVFLLAQEGGYEVTGEASTQAEALEVLREHVPHLVMLELLLPKQGGLAILQYLRRTVRDVQVLVFSATESPELLRDALQEWPHGYVSKRDSLAMLREALHTVSKGGMYWTPFATAIMDQRGSSASWHSLSPREREILRMVAEGLSSKEVAGRLVISPKTVDNHRSQLMHKLGVRNATELTRFAVRHGLVSSE